MSGAARRLGLRVLSGRLEGGVVPLQRGCALLVGRQPGADVLISEDLVSRRHARITYDGTEVVVEDLGSTNGTFVNGERVTRAAVREGDRVLVGETIFTVVARQAASAASATQLRSILDVGDAERTAASAIQGRLDEVPLIDLLQLVATARKTGLLVVRSGAEKAELVLERGAVVACTLEAHPDLPPEKAVFRPFGWAAGQFELQPREPGAARPPLMATTDALLLEAARQLDEMRRLRATLPTRFTVTDEVPEIALEPEDRALYALAERLGDLDAVLDATPLPDVVAAERLATLHARGVLAGVQPASSRAGASAHGAA